MHESLKIFNLILRHVQVNYNYEEKTRLEKDVKGNHCNESDCDYDKSQHDDKNVNIVVLLNKYHVFVNYINNNRNGSVCCIEIIDWKPESFDDDAYDADVKTNDKMITKYENSAKMEYFRSVDNGELNCDEIIELIKHKIEMTWAFYGWNISQCKNNIFVCDLLYEYDIFGIKYNTNGRQLRCVTLSEKILCWWIEQEGMQNVLTKDLIHLILKYYKDATITPIDQIFVKIHQLCTQHSN